MLHNTNRWLALALKGTKIGSLGIVWICVLFVWPLMTVYAALTDQPTGWANFSFVTYTHNAVPIADDESSSDPSNGGAAVQPAYIDITSCSPTDSTAGPVPSVLVAYHDRDGNASTLSDAWLAFRMRLGASPLEQGQVVGYRSYHWDVLIDIDADGYKEFVIDLDGSVQSQRPDRVYLLYNNLNTQAVTGRTGSQRAASDVLGGDEIGIWYAAGPYATGDALANDHTRVQADGSGTCGTRGDSQYWLDIQIPMTAFNVGGQQLITAHTPIAFFYSTSASNTNPMQKDWMMDADGPSVTTFVITNPIIFGDIYYGEEPGPTAVGLASFGVQATNSAVLVRWSTGSEIHNLGFDIYREAYPGGGDRQLLNDELIFSKAFGSICGAEYAFEDRDARPATAYAYWLESVDTSSESEWYGPAIAEMPANIVPATIRALPVGVAIALNRWTTFTSVYRDDNGVQDLATLVIAFGDLDHRLRYEVATGRVFYWSNGRWSQGKLAHQPGTIISPDLTIDLGGSGIADQAAYVIRIRWKVKFGSSFTGVKPVIIRAIDRQGAASGWRTVGTITIQ